MSQTSPDLSFDGLDTMYNTYTLAFQSIFYGIYVILMAFSAHMLLKKGLRSRTTITYLFAIFTPFLLSTLFWTVSLAEQIVRMRTFFVDRSQRNTHNILAYATLFNALVWFNYIFGDSVVVWRAYVLCREDYRKVLKVPIIFLVLTSFFVFGTIGIRIGTFFTAAGPGASSSHLIIRVLNVFQIGTLVWSLATNLSATLIITHKAWTHRQTIKDGLKDVHRATQAERILALLIESGIVYLTSSVALLVFMLIRLDYGTLGDIYTPVNLQIAGIYPTLVVVLVGMQRTMRETTFCSSSQTAMLSSAPRVGAIGAQNFHHPVIHTSERSTEMVVVKEHGLEPQASLNVIDLRQPGSPRDTSP